MKDIIVFVVLIPVALCFALGVIGILLLKKKGKSWTGQGYGK